MSFGLAEGKSNCTDPQHAPRSVVKQPYFILFS